MHFCHKNNLTMQEMHESAKVSCYSCNFLATMTIYIRFMAMHVLLTFCFNASRSCKHQSHPHHPFTLVPHPTYPSKSYCNSYKSNETGFSYSCSDCYFDLHAQCATNFYQPAHPVTSTQSHNFNDQNQEILSMSPVRPSLSACVLNTP